MSYTDRLNVDAHLAQALRHLETAEVMVRNLDVPADLTADDRGDLHGRSSSICRLARRIGDELDGVDVVYDLNEALTTDLDREQLAEA